MPPNELSLGTRGKRRKTTQQIFPSKDDEKDGSSKRHTLQTERSDTGPLFGSWRVTVLGGGSSYCQELREDSESIHFNHLVEQTGNQSQERLNSITPPRSHTCRVLLQASRLHSRAPLPSAASLSLLMRSENQKTYENKIKKKKSIQNT